MLLARQHAIDVAFSYITGPHQRRSDLANRLFFVSGLFARMDVKEVLDKVEAMHAAQEAAEQAAGAQAGDAVSGAAGNPGKAESVAGAAGNGQGAGTAGEAAPIDVEAKPEITYEDFAKLQFQVGEIIACEEVKKSRKLLCSQVKIGSQVRQIVSGIKSCYSPEEMVGKKVMVVTNLKPAKLAGLMSEGMLLCAEDGEGSLSLMVPEKSMPSGAEIC